MIIKIIIKYLAVNKLLDISNVNDKIITMLTRTEITVVSHQRLFK